MLTKKLSIAIVVVLTISLVTGGLFSYVQAAKSSVSRSGETLTPLVNPADGLSVYESFSRTSKFSPTPLPTTLLALNPAGNIYSPGDTFSVDVKIDTAYVNGQTTVGDVRVGLEFDPDILEFTGWNTEKPSSEFTTFYFHHASHSIIFFDEGRLLMSAHTEPGPTYTTGYDDPQGQVFRLSFKVKEDIPFTSIFGMNTQIEFNDNTGVWSIDDPAGFNYLADTWDGNYRIIP
ncbi:hypothetical protein ACFL24_00960 [Patescibacteria group bacterium]